MAPISIIQVQLPDPTPRPKMYEECLDLLKQYPMDHTVFALDTFQTPKGTATAVTMRRLDGEGKLMLEEEVDGFYEAQLGGKDQRDEVIGRMFSQARALFDQALHLYTMGLVFDRIASDGLDRHDPQTRERIPELCESTYRSLLPSLASYGLK